MSLYRLVGVTTPATADALIAKGATLAGAHLRVVRYPGLAALAVAGEKLGLFSTRKAQLEAVLAFQLQLEAALAAGVIVPAAYANALMSEADVLGVLAVGQARLSAALTAFAQARQYQITIGWDPVLALAHCAEHDHMRAALSAAGPDMLARGKALATAMETERALLAAKASATLEAAAMALRREPLGSETMVANLVVLVDAAHEARFDAALEAVDASFPGLSIKQRGPLPPVSFASISIERPDPRAVAGARRMLAVEGLDGDALQQAYRAAMKRAHPDRDGGDTDAATAVTKAYKLLTRLAEAERAGADRAKPILIDLVDAAGERWAA